MRRKAAREAYIDRRILLRFQMSVMLIVRLVFAVAEDGLFLFLLMYLFSEHCSFKPVGVRGHFLSCIKESIPHGATYFVASILLAVALFMMNKSMLNPLQSCHQFSGHRL
ncbi:MAG: hypothetical protein MJY43_02865 [Bacteroidales bacterium]|nr:hypothetical protein [Bacteroidales bacterium]